MVLLCACPCPEEPDTLSVSHTEFIFTADDTEEKVATITTNVNSWSIETVGAWITATKEVEDGRLHIRVENYNETGNPREGSITVSAGAAQPVAIVIKQEARASLSVDPEALSFDANESGSKPVQITTTASGWEAESDASWIKLAKQGNTLNVSVEANSGEDRSGRITLKAGNAAEKTVTVTQTKQHTLSVSPSSLEFTADETGEKPVTINTSAPSWNATKEASWITLTPQGNTLKVKVDANTGAGRSGQITVTAGNAPPVTISVTQEEKQHTLSVSPSSLEFTYNETGQKTVTVTKSASSYSASTNVSWIMLNLQSGTILVSVTAYSGTSSRTGSITVSSGNAPNRTVTVTQTGQSNTLSVSPTSLAFTYNESSQKTVTVTTNASFWSASPSASWITISKLSTSFWVSVSANSSTSSRSGSITISAGNAPDRTVTVTQTGTPASSGPWPRRSYYTGTGTPVLVNTTSSDYNNPWSGTVTPYPLTGTPSYYTFSNWAGYPDGFRCNYSGGKMIIDGSRLILEDSGIKVYFKAIIFPTSSTWVEVTNYEVIRNESTRTLDFSGTYNGHNVSVGYIFLQGTTLIGAITFSNAKLTITSTYSTPEFSGDPVTTPNLNAISENDLKKIISIIKKEEPSTVFKKALLP
jgi:hypothetical protein